MKFNRKYIGLIAQNKRGGSCVQLLGIDALSISKINMLSIGSPSS